MPKPKEWWIHADTAEGGMHVIEYSAYQKAVEALKEIASSRNGTEHANNVYEANRILKELGEME